MATAVRFSTLFVGQGQCSVIEVYDYPAQRPNPPLHPALPSLPAGMTLEYLAVIDCGSTASAPYAAHVDYSMQYIAALAYFRTLGQAQANTPAPAMPHQATPQNPALPGRIDLVHISHLDRDHWNLLNDIPDQLGWADAVPATPPNVDVGKIVIGGTSRWNYAAPQNDHAVMLQRLAGRFNVLTDASLPQNYEMPCAVGNDPYVPADHLTNPAHDFYGIGGGWKLCLNTLLSKAAHNHAQNRFTKSVFINGGSTMLLATILDNHDVPQMSALFTGDAVEVTFCEFLNMPIGGPVPQQTRFDFTQGEYKYLTVSHHGAFLHIYDTPDRQLALNTFLANYPFDFAIASAYTHGTFRHPRAAAMQPYLNALQHIAAAHDVTTHSAAAPQNYILQNMRYYRQACTAHLYTTYNINGTPPQVQGQPAAQPVPSQFSNLHLTYDTATAPPIELTHVFY